MEKILRLAWLYYKSLRLGLGFKNLGLCNLSILPAKCKPLIFTKSLGCVTIWLTCMYCVEHARTEEPCMLETGQKIG